MKLGLLPSLCVVTVQTIASAYADNQTATVTPVQTSGLPYSIELQLADLGGASLPTLQSYASGTYDGKWVLAAGRTNGLHSFTSDGLTNFPPEYQNTDIWVIDPVSKQSWSRSLNDATAAISNSVFDALSATATQSAQQGSTLYVVGGYLYDSGIDDFTTYNTLTALDLPGVIDWVQTGTGSLADSVRQTADETFRVTGGSLDFVGGKAFLTFGQDFEGPYTPGSNGVYTRQVRTFDIVDDGVTLSIANVAASTPEDAYRRRDLNVVPIETSSPDAALVALSGVFTLSGGAWTVPVEVASDGTPSMADPTLDSTFKQGMNGYDTAKLVLYSPLTGENHILLLGGISLQTFDGSNFVIDNNLPFTSQGSAIVRQSDGTYTPFYLGDVYPDVIDAGTGNPLLFGAEAEFFLNPDVALFNGFIDMDALTGPTLLGHVFGGIAAEQPNFGDTAASNLLFEVWFTPVPEPGTPGLLLLGALGMSSMRCRRFTLPVKSGMRRS